MNDIVLQTRNLNKYFHQPVEFHVLKDINISVQRGEFVSMIGKSGSGKSTLLYCLSTMDNDYNGELDVLTETVTGKKDVELAAVRNERIGFVFQFHYLLPEFSCLKNVMLPALKLGKYSYGEIEERAYKKLEILGIKDQALKQAIKLSGGQQQRVSIARALINEPDIILCDEPTGNLDSKNTSIVFDVFRQLVDDSGKSILVVTHDNDFADASDRDNRNGRWVDRLSWPINQLLKQEKQLKQLNKTMKSIILSLTSKGVFAIAVLFLGSNVAWAQGFELSEEQKTMVAEQIEQTKQQLQITDDQAEDFNAIMMESYEGRLAIMDKYGIYPNDPNFKRPGMGTMRKMRKEMDALESDTKKELSGLLTDDQLDTWEELEKERRDRMRDQMRKGN